MDTITLRHFINKIICKTHIKKAYVLARDELENIDRNVYPSAIIVNSSDSNIRNSGHWIAIIYWSPECSEFFDSYGNDLGWYGITFDLKNLVNNSKDFQSSISTVCGYYSLLYIHLRANRYHVRYFYSLFSKNKIKNDKIVDCFFKKLQKEKFNCINPGGQRCCPKKYLNITDKISKNFVQC